MKEVILSKLKIEESGKISGFSRKKSFPKGIERLKKLTDSAAELFLEFGYEAASVDMLINRVGGSRRNIYEYFGGKEGLFSAVISEECKKIAEPLEELALSDNNIRATLVKFGEELLQATKNPRTLELHRLMISEGKRFPELSREIWFAGHHYGKAILEKWILYQQSQGKINGDFDASSLSYAFLHMITSETQLKMLSGGREPTPEQGTKIINLAVEMFITTATKLAKNN